MEWAYIIGTKSDERLGLPHCELQWQTPGQNAASGVGAPSGLGIWERELWLGCETWLAVRSSRHQDACRVPRAGYPADDAAGEGTRAKAVVGFRLITSMVMFGAVEVVAHGTAVAVKSQRKPAGPYMQKV